jgi:flagellar motor switch protein FliN
MSEQPDFLDLWTGIATTLFSQALSGEPELAESLPKPMPSGSPAFTATIEGQLAGRFLITLDAGLLETTLLGEGVDQGAAWLELLRETVDATIGEMEARSGIKLKLSSFVRGAAEGSISRCYQLKTVERAWTVTVRDEIKEAKAQAAQPAANAAPKPDQKQEENKQAHNNPVHAQNRKTDGATAASGFDLLLDVELEASLRFGARELPLGEILELGPGDVVQLDRNIADPVDLLVGDKIVARGEVVLVNGNFALRVLEVAEPQRRLESVRCLF